MHPHDMALLSEKWCITIYHDPVPPPSSEFPTAPFAGNRLATEKAEEELETTTMQDSIADILMAR